MRLSLLTSAALAGTLALAGCDAIGLDSAAGVTADARSGNAESFIVVVADTAPPGFEKRLAQQNDADFVYSASIRGFAAQMSPQAAEALARNPHIAYVERDQIVELARPGSGGSGTAGQSIPEGITRVGGGAGGAGKTACVIDSGVDLDHPDLTVDVGRSRTFIASGKDARSADDGNGHGTHVAGTIAAQDNSIGVVGVAPGATIVAIKVLDSRGSGAYSAVIAGVDYAASAGCDVANMSLGGPVSQALDDAVVAASASVVFALAAGNESDDANNHSPARAGSRSSRIHTISAVDRNDRFASFSNYGPAVDYAAPGVSILSTYKGGGYATLSGTSMASPHAAGVLLLGAARTSGTAVNDPDGTPDPIIVH